MTDHHHQHAHPTLPASAIADANAPQAASGGTDIRAHAERLASYFPASGHPSSLAIQTIQCAYRINLVNAFGITAGERVLELGCGQGDMSVALADAVGPAGSVLATDPAEGSYGSPVTLGQSWEHLANGPLKGRLAYQLDFDINKAELKPEFDAVVLAHCTWYFESPTAVLTTLATARKFLKPGGRLCLAEWDLEPRTKEQIPHLVSALVQGHLFTVGLRTGLNVRTPLSRAQMTALFPKAGLEASPHKFVDTSELQDADWEIYNARSALEDAEKPEAGLSEGGLAFARSQLDVVTELAANRGNVPLPAYAVTATVA
ncbi:Methyltransferase ustM [Vanrija pseudolonga]|uniref:Methyltransferase ustM n=1 Tax=Vanrija pseudolonga TaxID=143232 RepID=A0AAF1BTX7_9TREE|nr:Methyltransferase ustM [Vanrija pseudolonga]